MGKNKSTNTCILCNQHEFKLVSKKDRNNKDVNNFICLNCGLVQIFPRSTKAQLDEIYSTGAFSAIARQGKTPDYKKLRRTEKLAEKRFYNLFKHVETIDLKTKSLLEIGCGTGSFLRFAKPAFNKCLGIDPDSTYSEFISSKFSIDIQSTSIEDFNPKEKFDFVISYHVIEHVLDPKEFIQKINNLLCPKGIINIECPDVEFIYGNTSSYFFWDVHLQSFSEFTLVQLLKESNFDIINVSHINKCINIIAQKKDGEAQIVDYNNSNVSKIIRGINSYDLWHNKIGRKINSRYKRLKERSKYGIEGTITPIADAIKQNIIENKSFTLLNGNKNKGSVKLTHIGLFTRHNAGDTLLTVNLRDLFESSFEKSIKWNKQHAHKVINGKSIRALNNSQGVIIGGGGLFLKDTNPNNLSGWQWSCSIESLKSIQSPLAIFAVGYNRFRNQEDFSPLFTEHLNLVAEKSTIIGLRNHGSINNIKRYIHSDHHHKLRFQPCMTTITSKIYGEKAIRQKETPPFISVNCAFDRVRMRFGENVGEYLSNLAIALRTVSKIAPIYYFSHHIHDEYFLPYLEAYDVDYTLVKLYDQSPQFVLEWYRKPLLSIGMRGHAQLIPFGSGRPIISLITHNKLKYFLEDINKLEWGLELSDPNLVERLIQLVIEITNNPSRIEEEVFDIQNRLYQITKNNIETIANGFNI